MRWIATFVLLVGCADGRVGSSAAAVVFGRDGRVEPHQAVSEVHAEIARSSVAVRIVDWAVDRSDPTTPRITYPRTLGESENLCEGEPFVDQIAPGSCSGTLIDDRVLLTAAHCVAERDECDGSHFWVFGFHMDADGELAELNADDVYGCTRVLASSTREDYALIELDRDVGGRQPVDTRLFSEGLALGTPLTLIGFPNGIPVKLDSTGVVTYSVNGRYFRATVDAFDSNSGSGVFDEEGRLVGVLQRGYEDYVPRGECMVVSVLDEGDPGEIVGYLDLAIAELCDHLPDSKHCACDGPCVVTPPNDAGLPDAAEPMDAFPMDAFPMMDATPDASPVSAPPPGGCSIGVASRSTWIQPSCLESSWIFLFILSLRRRRT